MIHNSLKEVNVKDVTTYTVNGDLTIHIYKNIALDDCNYYMSVLSHNIINYALGTNDLTMAKNKAISNLGHIIREYINDYNKTLDQLGLAN